MSPEGYDKFPSVRLKYVDPFNFSSQKLHLAGSYKQSEIYLADISNLK